MAVREGLGMQKPRISALSKFWRPELPLFAVGICTATIICILIAVVLWSTFINGVPGPKATYTLNNYLSVFLHPITAEAALNTLMLALGTVAVSIFFALPAAWLLHRTNIPLKKFFVTLMLNRTANK